jgi:hypothetical protein
MFQPSKIGDAGFIPSTVWAYEALKISMLIGYEIRSYTTWLIGGYVTI